MQESLKLCMVAVDLGPWIMAGVLVLMLGMAIGRWTRRP